MRASAVVEKAGIPSASLVCDGFIGQAEAITGGLGVTALPIARLPGHVDGQEAGELEANVLNVTVDAVIERLTGTPNASAHKEVFAPGDIVARGSYDEVNRIFMERQWSDGLPIVPPTEDRVAACLDFCDHPPEQMIGVMQPSGAAATVRNVAINGVMAGCRPEYMPVLLAIAEAVCDPGYGVEHSGDTTGGDALIILNGPIISTLGFNAEGAALRDGYQANTSVGRFLRLLLRNVARSLPEGADKSTFGHTWRVVLAEHEPALAALGWQPFSTDRGFAAGDDIVTVARFTSGGVIGSIYGSDPDTVISYLADGLVRHTSWELVFTVGFAPGTYRPLLVISPMVAKTLARDGLTKQQVREELFQKARLPARKVEAYIGHWTNLVPGRPKLQELVAAGSAAPLYGGDDPDRLVPIVADANDILLVISGDPLRSNAYAFASNGMHGFPTSKKIVLPDRWRRQTG
jgi:hypothetical protein